MLIYYELLHKRGAGIAGPTCLTKPDRPPLPCRRRPSWSSIHSFFTPPCHRSSTLCDDGHRAGVQRPWRFRRHCLCPRQRYCRRQHSTHRRAIEPSRCRRRHCISRGAILLLRERSMRKLQRLSTFSVDVYSGGHGGGGGHVSHVPPSSSLTSFRRSPSPSR